MNIDALTLDDINWKLKNGYELPQSAQEYCDWFNANRLTQYKVIKVYKKEYISSWGEPIRVYFDQIIEKETIK